MTLEAMQSALSTVFDELPNLVPDVTYQTWQLQFPTGTGRIGVVAVAGSRGELELGHSLNLVSSSVVGAQVGEQLFFEQGGLAPIAGLAHRDYALLDCAL
ncbi:hypothetical protein O9929_24490 [Vibrio lentus]|nr:hypothetical protein [Vibrio lentus]